MANLRYAPITDPLQGRVGGVVFRRWFGRLIAAYRPNPPSTPPTPDQLAQRVVFGKANVYANEAMADPERRAVYERMSPLKQMPARAVAIGDYFNSPEVMEIDLSAFHGQVGDRIKVRATDDVEVRSVHVLIRKSGDGTVLEEADAAFATGAWHYTCTTAIPPGTFLIIEAKAKDWAGNQGMKILNYP